MNRTRIPGGATGPRHVLRIQSLGERYRRNACGIVAEDPPNHLGLNLHYLPATRGRFPGAGWPRNSVAVTEPAARLAALDAASEAATCLVREVLQEQRVHRPLQADVQVCNVAFCEGDDVHASER
ncbi:MAG TPA: hypothetical protein VL882_22610 [Vicinamibacterales bacterium]|nr:hypothetical protein [Vicinamibacterales bacterium]